MFGIPKLYVKFWWPSFLAMKFTFLFLDLAQIHNFVPIGGREGGAGLGTISKEKSFCSPSLNS